MTPCADSPTLYKWLNGREANHVNGFRYRLGQWRNVDGPLVPCENGLHLVNEAQLSRWIARDLFVAEYDGEILDSGDKMVVRRARIVEHLTGWNERTSALAACDFAERMLPIWERRNPNDDRPRLAIQAGRDCANGLISREQAAWAAWAAWDAWDTWAAWAAWDAWDTWAGWDTWAARAARAARAAEAAEAAGASGTAEEREAQGRIILDYAYGRKA